MNKNAAVSIVLLALAAVSAPSAPLRDELSAYIEKEMQARRIVGMGVAVIADGQPVLVEGFGQADRERAVPVTAETLFPIGSTTKLFTATAIMQLVGRGMVDLDAPIETYLPEFSVRRREGQEGPITVRQLLTHHSGLPGNLFSGFQPDHPSPELFLELPGELGRQTLASRPGSVFAYSNLGYSLLGCVIEAATGTPYRTYVRQNILEPLGMFDTLMVPPAQPDGRITLGYRGRQSVEVYPIRDLPAGSMLSSAADMVSFMRMILAAATGTADAAAGRILPPSAFQQMITRQNGDVALDQDFSIGLGYWLIDPIGLNGERLASHGGDLPPFHSVLVTVPDAGIAVFLAGNSSTSNGAVIAMASQMVRTVYERVTGRSLPPRGSAPAIPMDPQTATSLAGHYASPAGLMEITARGSRLGLKIDGMPLTLRLVARADGTYTPEVPFLRLISLRPESLRGLTFTPFRVEGRQYVQIAAAGVAAGAAARFEPAPAGKWRERTGRYRIAGGGSVGLRENLQDIALQYDRRTGILLFRCRMVGQRIGFPLAALDSDQAVVIGCGTGLGELLEWNEGQEGPSLRWSGLTLVRE